MDLIIRTYGFWYHVRTIIHNAVIKFGLNLCGKRWRLVHSVRWFDEPTKNFPESLSYAHFNNSASNFL